MGCGADLGGLTGPLGPILQVKRAKRRECAIFGKFQCVLALDLWDGSGARAQIWAKINGGLPMDCEANLGGPTGPLDLYCKSNG